MSDALFEMFRGDDYALSVTITDDNDEPIDITGWQFWTTMKLSSEMPDDEAPVKVDIAEMDGPGAQQGIVNILLPRDQTKDLLPARYQFDIQCNPDGLITTVMSGVVQVKSDVTRRDS